MERTAQTNLLLFSALIILLVLAAIGTYYLEFNKGPVDEHTNWPAAQPTQNTLSEPVAPVIQPPTPVERPSEPIIIPESNAACVAWAQQQIPNSIDVHFLGNTVDLVGVNEFIYYGMDTNFRWRDGTPNSDGRGKYGRGTGVGENVNVFYRRDGTGAYTYAKTVTDANGVILGEDRFSVEITALRPISGSTAHQSPREPIPAFIHEYRVLSCQKVSPDAPDCGSTQECAGRYGCDRDSDCDTGACREGMCVVLPCDQIGTCETGYPCNGNDDVCASGLCLNENDWKGDHWVCRPRSCSNGEQDHKETSVDCGGGDCRTCPTHSTCESGSDCDTGKCCDGACSDWSC